MDRKQTGLELLGIGLIIGSFVIGQITPTPADFGISIMAARWLGILTGVFAIGLRYIPTPRPLDAPVPPAWTVATRGTAWVAGVDPQVQQLLDQNSHIGEALYALCKIQSGDTSRDWVTAAHAHVNALQPSHFTFP